MGVKTKRKERRTNRCLVGRKRGDGKLNGRRDTERERERGRNGKGMLDGVK